MFGTVRIMVFLVIELRTRAVHIGGMRINPDGAWMMQIVRNLLDPEDGFLRSATHLIHDRDPLFTNAWVELLKSSGVESVRIPASSPNCIRKRQLSDWHAPMSLASRRIAQLLPSRSRMIDNDEVVSISRQNSYRVPP